MLPPLNSAQRQAIAQCGGIAPVTDENSGQAYLLLPVALRTDTETGDLSARFPGLPVYGSGQTEEEALLSLAISLTTYLDLFGADDDA